MNEKNLVFICGALRSGSSLTHLILDHHPEINNPGEFDFLFDQISAGVTFPVMAAYEEWLSVHRIFQSKLLSIDSSLDYPELFDSFIAQLAQANCALTLNVHRHFDLIPYLFPNVKFIHLIRDPRDVARSSIGMGWAGNVYYGVDHWIETEKSWERLQEKVAPEQYMELSFEELILSPQPVLQKACDFIGVPYSESMLNFSDSSTYSELDPSLVYQWQKKLSKREIQYVESKAHIFMESLGYTLSGHPLITFGILEKIKLKIANKLFKLQFSIRRHGLVLVFKHRLSRLLNLKSMNKQVTLKMNDINKLYLK
ncbi:hypothetical protein AU255_03810 [Methyloprofundus sedimenti]|uniref:Sulfotransferase n=1 Tax=Methyloprofundus sedimenti TaxID=1420851 RepID=A0A1V8M632_9GAMM|nr:sulfotransferase [Methyloprofundus sedimenti]OQK17034.1 hypothetical protein AU255_03810 [Methyloprofundus sedimenti]